MSPRIINWRNACTYRSFARSRRQIYDSAAIDIDRSNSGLAIVTRISKYISSAPFYVSGILSDLTSYSSPPLTALSLFVPFLTSDHYSCQRIYSSCKQSTRHYYLEETQKYALMLTKHLGLKSGRSWSLHSTIMLSSQILWLRTTHRT
jgi:hypothetical protein